MPGSRQAEIEAEISELFEKQVRPHAQADGGDIHFKRFDPETGTVYVEMRGACVSCSSSTVTLRFMVLRLLQHYIDEVSDVEGENMEEKGET